MYLKEAGLRKELWKSILVVYEPSVIRIWHALVGV